VRRAIEVVGAGKPRPSPTDTLILTREQRQMRSGVVSGVGGTQVEFQFSQPVSLRTDDVLLLDNGDAVEVVAAPEPLFEVRGDLATLVRLAWALGDRHVQVQFLSNRIRFVGDPALEKLVAAWRGQLTRIEAPFEPEGGAYAGVLAHGHDHAHDHDHDGGRSDAHGHGDHHHDRHDK